MGVTARPTGPSSRGKWNRLQIKWSWVHIPLRPHRGLIVKQHLLRGLCGLKVCHFFLCFSNFRQKVWIFCISTRSAKNPYLRLFLPYYFGVFLRKGASVLPEKNTGTTKRTNFFIARPRVSLFSVERSNFRSWKLAIFCFNGLIQAKTNFFWRENGTTNFFSA